MCETRTLVAIAFLALAVAQQGAMGGQDVPLTQGMVIDRSMTIRPGIYRLPASSDLQSPAITIRGDDIIIDFAGAELHGADPAADPDSLAGVGILVAGGRSVTIRNAVVRGYKVGLLARKTQGLHLARNDFSYNWKQRLYSGVEKESLVDWMSFHQNEKDEWLRYGAAIYLSEVDGGEIDHNTAVQGQNGLMATRSSGLRIWNNTFQYLSAVGIGFYGTSHSTIMHNRIDWCVRGYSHGFYNRGQDSAGLLMYEQSSGNTVAYNSITHGGDGLFLWAGQSTMDTGQGGANDNYFYRNDFSHAPTNGIEATFSRNRFHENRVEECQHGVWGGYSYESEWVGNRFARNTEGIAIEHGQHNTIAGNTFDADETAIRLWQNAAQDPEWGYPRHRDTRSRGYSITGNTFRGSRTAVDITDTSDVILDHNTADRVATFLSTHGRTPNLAVDVPPDADQPRGGARAEIQPLPGAIDPLIPEGERRGRDTIIVDAWGPYDWKSPKLWPAGRSDERPLKLRVLGPEGTWTVASTRGASVSPRRGRVPGELTVAPATESPVEFRVTLEYRGAAVVSPRGRRTPAGSPYAFSYSRFFVPIDWQVRFFEYADATDPVKQPEAFGRLLAGEPIKTVTTDRLDYVSGRAIEDGVPRDRFALAAEGIADLPPGGYLLQVISDDGVRVWVDGELTIDSWVPHESRVDSAAIEGGRRTIKVEYYEVGGFAELRFDIQRK